MNPFLPIRLACAAIILVASPACSETTAEPQAATSTAGDTDAAVAELFAEGSKSRDERPAFTNETVLKLNPIVKRSMDALDRFDQLLPQLAAAREAGDKAGIMAIEAELSKLKTETDAAHTAFQAEKQALIVRDEYYNEVMLAAMEQFVAEAPLEIAEALRTSVQ